MKKYFVPAVLFTFSILIHAQPDKDFPELSQSDIANGKIIKTNYYDGTTLWGLINGGADIYLEYGFDKLLLQEIEMNDINFRCEIYKMNDGKAAFGIFSVSRYKCELSDTLTKFICITPFQVQAAVGEYYLSISNDKGDGAAGKLTLELFSRYAARINSSPIELPRLFGNVAFKPYKNQLKFIKGGLGIQNGFPEWMEMFDQFSNYEAYILPMVSPTGYANIAQIKFNSESDANAFEERNKYLSQNKIMKKIKVLSPDQIIFIESNFPEEQLNKFLN
ncbi:MAG: hypothetical protein CVV24_02555 [Ignavibacteriae bacterium HGW-Ignavibacteriae-3]|nr:MAG: hypothetical protein CVV24_02555 [Ignavibacteriae bacterium HGW-Ignavibacteriae-3]